MKEKHEIRQRLAASREAAPPPTLQRFIFDRFLGRVFPGQQVHLPKVHWLGGHEEAETLLFPPGADEYEVPGVLTSYRCDNLHLHNPVSDVRTVGGKVFHVMEYGHKVVFGKVPVPQQVSFNVLQRGLNPEAVINVIPYTAGDDDQKVEMMVGAFYRPLANLENEVYKEMAHAVYLIAPGSMVANAHFVQEIFPEGGDPWANDPLVNWSQFSGGVGLIIVNPLLTKLTKLELGLPHFSEATSKQRKAGMCWRDEKELYNEGEPFHLTLGDDITPTAVTLIADPYFGYDKKTTKHHMRRFTHLIGRAIEEHSGGAYGYVHGSDKRPVFAEGKGASGACKSEKGKKRVMKTENGKTYSRIGTRWGELQPGAKVIELTQELDDISVMSLTKEGLVMVKNGERKWFQRPDGTIVIGEDDWTEEYFATVKGGFASNFAPLMRKLVKKILQHNDGFKNFHPKKQEHLHWAPHTGFKYTLCSAVWREVEKNGKLVRTTNPRFLENPALRYDNLVPDEIFRAHGIDRGKPAIVDVSIGGERCNAPDHRNNITPLCALSIFGYRDPITCLRHMIVPITGKSQSTDGNKGNEDACTCGPFDSMPRMSSVEEAVVAMALARTRKGTPLPVYVFPAGFCGPQHKIDQDMGLHATSLAALLGEDLWYPESLIKEGILEKIEDFDYLGQRIPAHILGYRLTRKGRSALFGKMWVNPEEVIPDELLMPELQDPRDAFPESIQIMEKTQREHVTAAYFGESEFEYASACPEIQIMLSLMKDGHWNGKTANDPEIQDIYNPAKLRDRVLSSSWYKERLVAQQRQDIQRLELFAEELRGSNEIGAILAALEMVKSKEYLESLHGTIGANRI